MKTNCMKNVLKKLAFPLVACGCIWAGCSALAQTVGDINYIWSPTPNVTIRTSGSTVDMRIRLFSLSGNFTRQYQGGLNPVVADVISPFLIRVETGNGFAYAKLVGMDNLTAQKTELRFQYTVRAGDLALPMKLVGSAGASTAGEEFQFLNNQWRIYNIATTSNVVWRYTPVPLWDGPSDPTFALQNIRLQTIDFETATWSVPATKTLVCTVKTDTPVSNSVPFYVWSGNTNIAKIVEQQEGQLSAPLFLPAGATEATFHIYGTAMGSALIYLSPAASPTPGVTNYTTKTVTVTAPPPPTVAISLPGMDTLGSVTLNESDNPVNPLTVTLSETYATPVQVRLDTTPVGQVNVIFASSPMYVTVPAGSLASVAIPYSAADGTLASKTTGIRITPVITAAAASNYFTIRESAVVKVLNVAPVIVQPVANVTKKVDTLKNVAYTWEATDVAADMTTGMTVTWNFGDGSLEQTVAGASGTISHMYDAANTYTVTVTAKDKDGLSSAPVSFFVEVKDALPVPYVQVIPSAAGYNETNGLGSLFFSLSKRFSEDTWVQLRVEPAGQSNIVFGTLGPIPIYANETNSATLEFEIKDGTEASRLTGLTFVPEIVSNAAAIAYFTPRTLRGVKINNQPPEVTRVLDMKVGSIGSILIPAVIPKEFTFEVADVDADLNPVTTYWNFGDGSGEFIATAVTNRKGFARGALSHAFPNIGNVSRTYLVTVRAEDKDNGVSADVEFSVVVGPPPTVSILPPSGPLLETPNAGEKDFILVQLSSAFTNAVTVNLAVAPANSPTAGTLILENTQVVFPAGVIGTVLEQKVYISSTKDGTDASASAGFTITPTVLATPASQAFYGANLASANVRILNVAPVITEPVPSPITGTEVAYTIAQDTDKVFYWNVTDVMKDWTNNGLTIIWYWGDDTTTTIQGGRTGSTTHKYGSVGDKNIHVVVMDKDGGYHDVWFKIRVAPAKELIVTPVGPVFGGTYASAPGLGNGLIFSADAASRYIEGDVYYFKYGPSAVSAKLLAWPYKTSKSGSTIIPYMLTNYIARVNGLPGVPPAIGTPAGLSQLDSFFYVWQGTDQGLPEDSLVSVADAVVTVTLPEGQADATGGASAAVTISQIKAVFSREWRSSDNVGDISNDGIPDLIANLYGLPALVGGDMLSAADYNADLDFLPGAASAGGGIIGGSSNTWAAVGRPFTAFLEIRGMHEGLNRFEDYHSDPDFGPGEQESLVNTGLTSAERPTDPTLADTDGDGYPDGWEYFFWYQTLVNKMSGRRYNPQDVASGEPLAWSVLYPKFDPRIPATDTPDTRDLDNDGITDYEELVTGTNPIDWDSDGDGMCDGWEMMRGLNPSDARDGLSALFNNPDGDFMAIATVQREYVPVALLNGTTNFYLRASDGSYATWYNYGNSNAPIALGRPVTLPSGAAPDEDRVVTRGVLLLHFQVYHQFGFDPRTAWTASVNQKEAPARFASPVAGAAPNTRPFTALDEYLLMKFMSENRLNGATASIGAGNATDKTRDWTAFSTHPRTTDSDATATDDDGLPDGWELYVSCEPGTRFMGINPWNPLDGEVNSDPDTLNNRREFAGTDSCYAYAAAGLYGAGPGRVTITRPAADTKWLNKFWPTEPWNEDTDGDGLLDNAEAATRVPVTMLVNGAYYIWWTTLQYGPGTDNGEPCIRGAGLNPCTMDTDWDALTDTWEYDHAGTNAVSSATGVNYVESGMDGTHGPGLNIPYQRGDAYTTFDSYVTGRGDIDRNMDYDRDGLENYQEYWVQAVRGFRYDYTQADAAMSGSDGAAVFFVPITNPWDYAKTSCWWPGRPQNMLLRQGPWQRYVSTDPREPDTDFDGMDDFYEMFHGLNPILGQLDLIQSAFEMNAFHNGWNTVPGTPLPMDFVKYPWLAGLDEADPDADGLRNLEEQIQPDTAAPACSNTDPTPLWLTDVSSPVSVTARFYGPGSMFFWPANVDATYKVFSFEMNEGYDTDNDGVSDKAEKMQTSTTMSDPQDHDDPLRRQAIWFSGQDSVAQTLAGYSFNEWSFRSFTVELWARPENVTRDQVLIERPVVYGPSDLSTSGDVVRVNFRIGIDKNGQVYAMFQNAGVHDDHTGVTIVNGPVVALNTWVHIAARMDGSAGKFQLFVNGLVEAEPVATTLIPANGVVNILADPDSEQYPTPYEIFINPGMMVLGAANLDPFPPMGGPQWSHYTNFYQGYIDEVRVWDGVRSEKDIFDNYTKRFTKVDLLANRQALSESLAKGGSRVTGVVPQLPAELIYHYTFDNLFSADRAEVVAKVPRGFNYWSVVTNRPAGYQVGWWSALATSSTVYNDGGYIPWIENGVEHLPLADRTVRNSIYWSHDSAGELPTDPAAHGLAEYSFPDSNNPYGFWYKTSLLTGAELSSEAGEKVGGDLLPLGGAYAKQVAAMWDGDAPSGVWAETGTDADADGLPDWWETLKGLNPESSAGDDGWYGNPDSDGVTNGERYLRDIANGWMMGDTTVPTGLKQTADADFDGLPDWWEGLYNLKVEVGVDTEMAVDSANGAMGDPDRDGLNNYAEYLISEKYGFSILNPQKFKTHAAQTVSDYFLKQGSLYFGEMLADHDFMEDDWEQQFDPLYVSRFVYDPHMDNDEDGWSNWAESRYSSAKMDVRPDLVMSIEMANVLNYEFPIPVVETTLRYNGIRPNGGTLVLNVYSTPSMDGQPDAVFTLGAGVGATGSASAKTLPIGYSTGRVVSGFLSPGNVVPGTISLEFTDMWTDKTGNTAFDVDGVMFYSAIDGSWFPIGTVDYSTGEYEMDLTSYSGKRMYDGAVSTNRPDYIECDVSFIQIDYSVSLVGGWPKKLYLGRADTGYIREGKNYLFAFMDLDGNGAWSAGEPCGVPEPAVTDIGWHLNRVSIDLTDYMPGYLRLSLLGGQTSGGGTATPTVSERGTHVRVIRTRVDDSFSYQEKVFDTNILVRTYLHEGDLLAGGQLALDWGLVGVPPAMNPTRIAYNVIVGDDLILTNNVVASFTNTFSTARAQAVSTYPVNGAYVYASRPTFKWAMPQEYNAFTIEIKRGSPTGPTVYNSGAMQVPARDAYGNCVWTAPIYANTRLPNGEVFAANMVYAWRVIAMNAKYSDTASNWSEWKLFRLDVNTPIDSSGYGAIRARVKYFGAASSLLGQRVKVQAFRNAAFAGLPEAEYTLAGSDLTALTAAGVPTVNAVLKGLAESSVSGNYYVRAFIDHNLDGTRDVWESWGYANYYGINNKAYDARAVRVAYAPQSEVVDIVIEDADTDQDWFPDAWEFEQNQTSADFLALTGPATGTAPDTEVNPTLSAVGRNMTALFATLSQGTTDLDGDGLGDMAELLLGSDARAASTSGDGYSDGDKVLLGLAPEDTLRLNLIGLNVSDALQPEVQWTVEVQKAAATSPATLSLVSSTAASDTVTYEVLYTPSLTNPQWQRVQSGTVALEGVKTLTSRIEAALAGGVDPAQGFFRVRLLK